MGVDRGSKGAGGGRDNRPCESMYWPRNSSTKPPLTHTHAHNALTPPIVIFPHNLYPPPLGSSP